MGSLRDRVQAKATRVRTGPFVVLFVCTGNVCRSPMADRLLAANVEKAGLSDLIRVSSAGVRAMSGHPMTEQAAEITVQLGGDPAPHRARDLVETQIEEADLVIGMAREHRSAIVRLVPRAVPRTFTLIELARLLEVAATTSTEAAPTRREEVPGFLRHVVAEAAASRGLTALLEDPAVDDVVDPYHRSQETYDASAEQIRSAGASIQRSLASMVGRNTASTAGDGHSD
jgi:protein-tyrosine phosphatase